MNVKILAVPALAIATGAAVALLAPNPAIVNPKQLTVQWCPGGYSNFVVVSQTNLGEPVTVWPTYLETTGTNFHFQPTEAQRFFALYGTNSDGDFGWAGDTNQ